MASDLKVTVFGTSPKFLTMCDKKDIHPCRDFSLGSLRAVLSTGAPLSVENFHWVEREVGQGGRVGHRGAMADSEALESWVVVAAPRSASAPGR